MGLWREVMSSTAALPKTALPWRTDRETPRIGDFGDLLYEAVEAVGQEGVQGVSVEVRVAERSHAPEGRASTGERVALEAMVLQRIEGGDRVDSSSSPRETHADIPAGLLLHTASSSSSLSHLSSPNPSPQEGLCCRLLPLDSSPDGLEQPEGN